MENQRQQLYKFTAANHCQAQTPKAIWGGLYLVIMQDLSQAIEVVESDYYSMLVS
jgi:hypothetical protein